MYKKITAVLLAALLLLSLGACGKKTPPSVSDSFEVMDDPIPLATPAAGPEEPPAVTGTASPELHWVESEDGQSISAVLPGSAGENAEIIIGIVEGDNQDAFDAPADAPIALPPSAPSAPAPAPANPQEPITNWTGPDTDTTLEEYEAMSGEAQTLFYYSFANADDFLAWYNTAKAASEAGKDYIEIGLDGTVSAGG